MRGLSISRAWDESRDILARDGRLFVSIALCLVALPTLIMGLLNPKGMGDTGAPLWISVVSLIASLVALGGQLALIRLALAPSITVADAINHGMRRMPIYLVSAIIIVVFLVLMAFPFAFILAAMGVPIAREETMTLPITHPGHRGGLALSGDLLLRRCQNADERPGSDGGADRPHRRA